MELWLILGILAYLSFAISTSIDKYMMNQKYDVVKTQVFKSLFNGSILLVIGLALFSLNLTFELLLFSLTLGIFHALAAVFYYVSLKLKDVGEVVPFAQSSTILLVFLSAIILFNEFANVFNYIAIPLILVGVYFVLSKEKLKLPKIDKGFCILLLYVIFGVAYVLLVKKFLFNIEPINLAIMMYFSTALILAVFQLASRKSFSLVEFKPKLSKILAAASFGAIGTFLFYSALSIGDASKVYPVAGLESVFIFIIATLLLKEKFYWHRLIGTAIVFSGILLISL